jgi:diadenylate cyclase
MEQLARIAGEDAEVIKIDIGPAVKKSILNKAISDIDEDSVFIIEPDDVREDVLRLRIGGTFVPLERYSNVAFIAREAALRVLEIMGKHTPERLAFVLKDGVIDGLSGVIVTFDTESLKISESTMRELKGFDIRVIERVLQIAEEIRDEGREGKKVGTLFVIGNPEELEKYTKQLVLNPFKGYLPEERNILSEELKETIKEFAQLDGAFIISKDGIVQSAGTYMDVDTSDVRQYSGWGTRHLAAAAITAKTDSIAVLVSESGGRIKVFRHGKIIMRR